MAYLPLDLDCNMQQWQCSALLNAESAAQIRRAMMLQGFKWDTQVGDVNTLAPFALILLAQTWRQLAYLAECLTQEMLQAEAELQERPDLWQALGLPRSLRQAMSQPAPWTPAAARVIRFDFHPTPDGWRISEANSDVPGGYTEASNLCKWMSEQLPGTIPAGDPAGTLVDALVNQLPPAGQIAFLSAPGYLEDQQITTYLAQLAQQRGCVAHLATPDQVQWQDGSAYLHGQPLDAILRFYQGEWLPRSRQRQWVNFFRGGQTPVCNPGAALLTESKRLPLVWHHLQTALPTWKALLPPTHDPRQSNWLARPPWLLKTAYCNTGDTVTMRGVAKRLIYLKAVSQALLLPQQWIAQQQFENATIATPWDAMYPCVGVYTINGKAAGIYGQMAPQPLINFAAIDVAILIQDVSEQGVADELSNSV
ncbi:MAG: glutathionylspermidine synthase family protein [Stenomitos frigidus ULC029]